MISDDEYIWTLICTGMEFFGIKQDGVFGDGIWWMYLWVVGRF